MIFKLDDRVLWRKLDDGGFYELGAGTVTDVNHALEKLHVRWDNGKHGWCYVDEIEPLDVITRLGELA